MGFSTFMFKKVMIERQARKASFEDFVRGFTGQKKLIEGRIKEAEDTKANRKKLTHVIGIERWGQRRLKVVLGEPFVSDEHEAYCPDVNLSWKRMRAEFSRMRQETIGLIRSLAKASPTVETVEHNDLGELTAKEWLRYLTVHADFESKRLG